MTNFKIKDIRPNPFRNLESYPIRKDKIEVLRESLRATGFWDNVVARMGDDGFPQIAYGHHRLSALREEYPPDHEVDLIIKDLDNDQMLKIMARENMDEYGSSAMVDMETVKATLNAYGAGLINDMPQPHRRATNYQILYAGDAACRASHAKPYDSHTVAQYLGWMVKGGEAGRPNGPKARTALRALEIIDEGYADLRDFEQFTTKTTQLVVQHVNNIRNVAEENEGLPPEVAHEKTQQIFQIAKNITSEGGGPAEIRSQIMSEGLMARSPITRPLSSDPNLSMLRVAMQIEKIFDHDDIRIRQVSYGMNLRESIQPDTITRLDQVLAALIERTQELRDTLHAKGNK